MKQLSDNQRLASKTRFMVGKVLDLRANNWIPRHEETTPTIINERHSETGQKLGLNPRATNMPDMDAGNSFGVKRDTGGTEELCESMGTIYQEAHKLDCASMLKETEALGATVTISCDTYELCVGEEDNISVTLEKIGSLKDEKS